MGHQATVDRFSVLPWELLDNIIGRLHILDAVRTTILSRSWKDKWAGVSKVVFDEYSWGTAFEDGEKFVKLVHHVLLSHHGQIQKFMISVRPNFDTNYLDRWILLLSTNAIEELVLDFNKKQLTRTIYKLPSSLFSCQQLRHLHLTNCKVVLPDTLNGFSNLASLQLSRFSAYDGKVVERLIRNCPLLDALALSWFSFDHLAICAPNLKSLSLEGDFTVYIENSPHLTDASFLLVPIERDVTEMAKSSGPSDCQFQLGKLALSGWYMEYLAIRCIPLGAFVECNTLKVLKLSLLHFDVMDEISVLFSFLGRCSNLKELGISGPTPRRVNEDVCKCVKAQTRSELCFNQLLYVKISISACNYEGEEIEDWRCHLGLIKLLLARSPILEKMSVNVTDLKKRDIWFTGELLTYEQASERLTLEYSSTFKEKDSNGEF